MPMGNIIEFTVKKKTYTLSEYLICNFHVSCIYVELEIRCSPSMSEQKADWSLLFLFLFISMIPNRPIPTV